MRTALMACFLFCSGTICAQYQLGPGHRTIPQVANGELAGTAIWVDLVIANIGTQRASYTLRTFRSQSGAVPLPLPYFIRGTSFDGQVTAAAMSGQLPVGGSVLLSTMPAGFPLMEGWGTIESDPPDMLTFFGRFTQRVAGRFDYQATIPIGNRAAARSFIPFIDSPGYTTTFARVNDQPFGQTAVVIAKDKGGAEICRDTFAMGAFEHQAFVVRQKLPCVSGREGMLELTTMEEQGLAVMGFSFADGGPFTSLIPTFR